MARIEQSVLTRTITADAQAHPHDLASNLARRHAVTRATILRHLKRLVELGWLEREAGGSARFKPGPQREVNLQYPTAGLDEHTPWVRDVQPMLALAPAAARLAQHVFGEILNNAVDHGEATTVNVSIRQTPSHLHLLISDDGVGVFDQLARRAGLADVQRAALELAKGRLTTQPAAHGGRGLFFVARMVEAMNVQSNGQVLQWRDRGASVRLLAHPLERPGTTVFVSLRLDTDVRTSDAYGAYGSAQAPLDFSRTQVPLRLLTDAGHALDSRAQARWVVSRLELFATAELDFDGVEDIGPSFIDEVFRVYALAHPQVTLEPKRPTPHIRRLLAC